MLAHLLDHFIFSSKRYTRRTKAIYFGICAFSIVGTFWWFKGVAFGIEGPIREHTGLLWRKVGFFPFFFSFRRSQANHSRTPAELEYIQ